MSEASPPPAIVAGVDTIAGLAVGRTLTRHGVRVIGIANDRRHFSCYTRACERILVADITGAELVETLEHLAAAGERGVVVPCSDGAVLALARSRDRVEPAHWLPLPDLSIVEMLGDKAAFHEYAIREGLPVPNAIVLEDAFDALRAAETLRFPCALKPSRKTGAWVQHTGRKAFKVETPAELVEIYARVAPSVDRLLAQEWIAGDTGEQFVFRGYFDREAKPLATCVCRKIRSWPIDTGIGVSAVECRNDAVLSEGLRLFESVGFHGHAMLEMKRNAATGEHLIVEPNIGRPTALAALAERAGIGLIYTGYCDALGLPLPSNRRQLYRGTKCVLIRDDVRAALALRRRGRLTARAWLRSLRGPKVELVFSLADPLPFLVDLAQAASRFLKTRVGIARTAGRRLTRVGAAAPRSE